MSAPGAPIVTEPSVRAEVTECGTLLRLTLNRPKGNVLDAEMVAALREEIARASAHASVRTVLFAGAGPHFSFGASVAEHQPDQVEAMLKGFHALFREMLDSGLVLLAAVQGQCLGGGLELAAFCHQLFASHDAKLGQPEIKLGVFAPIASVILPLRLGQARADDLLLTGRSVGAEEGARLGLVDHLTDDPVQAALHWHQEHLLGLSGVAVRFASRAGRTRLRRALTEDLATVERLYLEELMATHDAPEGIAAFLDKRRPAWTNK